MFVRDAEGPLFVGGLGGSGTRAVAGVFAALGYDMGRRVNEANEGRALKRFGRIWGPRYVRGHAPGAVMRAHLELALALHLGGRRPSRERWGWKHPQSHLLLPFLLERFPDLRFVQVVRDGRDMAFSPNLGQLMLYGRAALGRDPRRTPEDAIRYWAWANERAADAGERLGEERYLLVRFEQLCEAPAEQVARLAAFGDVPYHERAVGQVHRPATIGRWREAPPDLVATLERAAAPALARFGYSSSAGWSGWTSPSGRSFDDGLSGPAAMPPRGSGISLPSAPEPSPPPSS